jgi:hypothetical protein
VAGGTAPAITDCAKIDPNAKPTPEQIKNCPRTLNALGQREQVFNDASTATQIAAKEIPGTDQRGNLQLNLFMGWTLDTFAADKFNNFVNQGASGDVKYRITGGFDGDYRLFQSSTYDQQLWIFGRAKYGVRSAAVEADCAKNPDLDVCKLNQDLSVPKPSGTALYILRNATSLEAFMGFRWEFLGLNLATPGYARLYVSSELGGLSVSGANNDVIDAHQFVALGARVAEGDFKNTFFEVGWGRTDLFEKNRNRRVKFTARGVWHTPVAEAAGRPVALYAQFAADTDFGRGADSIQTELGLIFDFSAFYGM